MRWVHVRGFRSVRDERLELARERVNCLMGLNDHGKSNFLRAIHLFFTDQPEPDVPFDFERDVTQGLTGQRRRVVVDVGLDRELAPAPLLKSIQRTRISSTEEFALRRVWRRSGVQDALLIGKDAHWKVYEVAGEGRAVLPKAGGADEDPKRVHAPDKFHAALSKLRGRFRVRYLPSTTEAETYRTVGLADDVRRYLIDAYAKGPGSLSKALQDAIEEVKKHWHDVVGSQFAPDFSGQLRAVLADLAAVDLPLPEDPSEFIPPTEVSLASAGRRVALGGCGSGSRRSPCWRRSTSWTRGRSLRVAATRGPLSSG
jgi:hypothetical protein